MGKNKHSINPIDLLGLTKDLKDKEMAKQLGIPQKLWTHESSLSYGLTKNIDDMYGVDLREDVIKYLLWKLKENKKELSILKKKVEEVKEEDISLFGNSFNTEDEVANE